MKAIKAVIFKYFVNGYRESNLKTIIKNYRTVNFIRKKLIFT